MLVPIEEGGDLREIGGGGDENCVDVRGGPEKNCVDVGDLGRVTCLRSALREE
jgi:hypothetical protein